MISASNCNPLILILLKIIKISRLKTAPRRSKYRKAWSRLNDDVYKEMFIQRTGLKVVAIFDESRTTMTSVSADPLGSSGVWGRFDSFWSMQGGSQRAP